MIDQYLYLAVILFVIGAVGVMIRRNALVAFMSVELMLNAANLALVAFTRMSSTVRSAEVPGQIMAFFVLVVAAAEVVVGLAIIIAVFRARQTISLDEPAELKG